MISIKFINATNVQLLQKIGGVVDGTDTIVSNVGEFISPTEFQYNENTFSKDDGDYYHFAITGENVQISGTIGEVTTAYLFFSLFSGCSQITDASQLVLNGSTVKDFCFSNMFKDCVNLINPPTSLSAMNLAPWCYQGMFAGCVKMTSAPTLPATTLAPYCYYAMFYNCKALSSSPYLPAQTLTDWCYNSMFYGCENLTEINCLFDYFLPSTATKNWVTDVAENGTFNNQNVWGEYGVDKIPTGWKDLFNTPLTFKAVNGPATVQLNVPAVLYSHVKKSFDNGLTWEDYLPGTQIVPVELNQNQTVMLSCDSYAAEISAKPRFSITGYVEAKGNIHSLTNFDTTLYTTTQFSGLFANCTGLITAPILPASTLVGTDYIQAFSGCTSLTRAPKLPATTIAQSCYKQMFRGCTSLSTAPYLPAKHLYTDCYREMFRDCSRLSSVSVEFIGWYSSEYHITSSWLSGVAVNGTFTCPSTLGTNLTISRGDDYCPQNWTVINK